MEIMNNNLSIIAGLLTIVAFAVNIIVQLTKEIIPLPTKLWCIVVSITVSICSLYIAATNGYADFDTSNITLSILGAFIIAFASMYGFDTLKEIWERFSKGENINE